MSDDKEIRDLAKRKEDKLDLDVFKSGKGEYRAVRKKLVKGLAFQNDEEVSEYLKDNAVPLGADAVRVYIPKRYHDVLKAGSDPASVWKSLQKFVIEHSSGVLIEQVVKDLHALALRGETGNAIYELERLANPYGECVGVYRAVNEMLEKEAEDEDYGLHVKALDEVEREIDRMEAIRERLQRDQEDADELEELRKGNKAIRRKFADEIEGLKSQIAVLESDKQRLEDSLGGLANAEGMRKFTYWLSDWRSDYRFLDMRETLRMMATYCYGLGNDIEALKYENKQLKEKRHFFRR